MKKRRILHKILYGFSNVWSRAFCGSERNYQTEKIVGSVRWKKVTCLNCLTHKPKARGK